MSSRRRHPGFDGDNIAGFENEAMEAQIRFETSWDQKRKNCSSKKVEKKEWERYGNAHRSFSVCDSRGGFSGPSLCFG